MAEGGHEADDDIGLRLMREEDVPVIMAIEERVYPFPWTAGIFRDCMRAGYSCYVLDRSEEVIGYAVMSVGAREAHILNVCVSPAARGVGYGRIMMDKMISLARRLQADMMFLEVRPSNEPARRLYASMGFHEIGTRPGYYPAKDGREDALILARQLM